MSQPIDAAPKDGSLILLEGDTSGAYDVASWSSEAGTWVGKNGEPRKIKASQCLPIPSETWSKASAAPEPVPRGLRRKFAILAIASVVVAFSVAFPFRYEVSAFLTQLPRLHAASSEESGLAQPDTSQAHSKADQAGTEAPALDTGQNRRAATALVAHQPPQVDDQFRRELGAERERSAALAKELDVMRHEIEPRAAQSRRITNDAKLQEQAAARTISALRQTLQAERDKFVVLQEETSAVRKAMLADDEEHRRALDEARARYAALASELAGVRREIDLRAASPPQAADQAEKRQALENTVADLRRSLQQEREKTATLLTESENLRLTIAANSEQYQRALDGERQRSAALADELAATRSESERQAASSRKAEQEVVEQRQTLESMRHAVQEDREKIATLEKRASAAAREALAADEHHRRALDEERGRRTALLSELAGAQRQVETQAAELRKATETMHLRQTEVTGTATRLKQERETPTAQAEAPLETRMEPNQSRKPTMETWQPEEAEAATNARLLEEKRERTATPAQKVAEPLQEPSHLQPLQPARRLATGGNELATQRLYSVQRNTTRLNRRHSPIQSWPLLWLLGLDPRWQKTMQASVSGRLPFR